MFTRLDEEKLKSGETLEIGVLTAPDERLQASVEELLGHKGEHWRAHISAALRGETDRLETRFYLGLLEGRPVANIMTVEQRGVGILGHVFTRPEQRRKGIASAVMARQMEDFRRRGGHVLLLGTGFESPPYWIYHSFGFRSLRGGFMRYAVEPDFENRWLAPAPAQVVRAEWRHWPLVALLASIPSGEVHRSVAWNVREIENLEGPYVQFMDQRRKNDAFQSVMLETDSGAVTGCATVVPVSEAGRALPGDWLVDVFTHPSFTQRTADLLQALTIPSGRAIAYADINAPAKTEALQAAGFEPLETAQFESGPPARLYVREGG